ncbi:hypothetical protein, partial [Aneurinibacillus aneurinilyticus]|uniref:hypothetical protein n=1 Tax=Aneurinibacillus aneurinilyticus TaxID=1391 RepID=UPI0023F879E7
VKVAEAKGEGSAPIADTYVVTITGAEQNVEYTLVAGTGFTFAQGVTPSFKWETPQTEAVSITSVEKDEALGKVTIKAENTTVAALQAALSASYKEGTEAKTAEVKVAEAKGEGSAPIADTYVVTITGAEQNVEYTLVAGTGFTFAKDVTHAFKWTV